MSFTRSARRVSVGVACGLDCGDRDSLLERVGIEEEIVIRVRAIHELALEIVRADKTPEFPQRL